MTDEKETSEKASDRPSVFENVSDPEEQGRRIILEFGNLDSEKSRIAYIQTMILGRVIPPFDSEVESLEAALWNLPRGTVNKVMPTWRKLYETQRDLTAVLLDAFEPRNVA